MEKPAQNKSFLITVICCAVFFSFVVQARAAGPFKANGPRLLTLLLNGAGIKTQQTNIAHDYRILKALFFNVREETPVVIGLPRGGLRRNVVFPLIVDDIEMQAKLTDDDSLVVVSGDREFVSQGVFDVIECIIFGLHDSAKQIAACAEDDLICMLENTIVGMVALMLCPINIL